MKRLFIILTLCANLYAVRAEQTITGKVMDAATNEPVIGASVVVTGTTIGTATGIDGSFSLEVPDNARLTVSYIGMTTQEVAAADNVVIALGEDTHEIDEVMVVAFGTATKKSYTGSASVIKTENLTKRQTSNVTNALAGQVAGVQGLSISGQPGEVANIRIRGIGSMSASNAPLYVVDGVPVSTDYVSALSNVDIESVTILKDAASNALYGARGANGVVLINTRRGTSQKARITLDAKWGTNRRAVPKYDVMTDPAQYYETFYQALYNGQILSRGATPEAAREYADKNLLDAFNGGLGYQVYTIPGGERLISADGKLNPHATLGYVNSKNYTLTPDDWYDELFSNNNFRHEYNLTISGSSDKINYFVSSSFLGDKGIIEQSSFDRFTARTNVEYQAAKWLKIGTNMNYSHANKAYPQEDVYGTASSWNIFYISNFMAPIYPMYIRDAQGKIMKDANGLTMYDFGDGLINGAIRPFMSMSNPAAENALNIDKEEKDYFNGKWFVQIELYKGLKISANIGVGFVSNRHQSLLNTFYGQYAETGGSVKVRHTSNLDVDQQYLLTYNNRFNGRHQVDLLLGYENYMSRSRYLSGTNFKIYSPDIAELNNAIIPSEAYSSTHTYKTQSILVQAKYSYADKYYISGSYSRMATSHFAPAKRWGNFWSIGLAWDIKGEKFLENIETVDLLKLKASYGAQGNDDLDNDYPYTDQYLIYNNNGEFAALLDYKGNPDLTWETSYNFNCGVDFAFLGERIGGSIEGWRRRTEDQLYYKPVPPSLGYNKIPVNIGSVSNVGVDIELHGDIVHTKNIRWGLYLNLTYWRNRILKLAPELNGSWIDGTSIYKEGESMYNRYLKSFAGVDRTNGASLWYKDVLDAEGNVVDKTVTANYNEATQYATGDILPKVYGGFGTTLDVYGVDFSLSFNYQAGGRLYDSDYRILMHGGYSSNAGKNWHKDILQAWTPAHPDSNVPALNSMDSYVNGTSDRWLISSDYVSLQNITLGYSFPKMWIIKMRMRKLRVYAVADNIAVFAKRKGLDPRQSLAGNSNGMNYSPIRTISAGIQVEF